MEIKEKLARCFSLHVEGKVYAHTCPCKVRYFLEYVCIVFYIFSIDVSPFDHYMVPRLSSSCAQVEFIISVVGFDMCPIWRKGPKFCPKSRRSARVTCPGCIRLDHDSGMYLYSIVFERFADHNTCILYLKDITCPVHTT